MGEATRDFPVSKPAISRHLRVLEEAGAITRVIDGRTHRLRLSAHGLAGARRWLDERAMWEQKFDVLDDYLAEQLRGKAAATITEELATLRLERDLLGAPRRGLRSVDQPGVLARWWGPSAGDSSPGCDVDLRVGGRYVLRMRGPQTARSVPWQASIASSTRRGGSSTRGAGRSRRRPHPGHMSLVSRRVPRRRGGHDGRARAQRPAVAGIARAARGGLARSVREPCPPRLHPEG